MLKRRNFRRMDAGIGRNVNNTRMIMRDHRRARRMRDALVAKGSANRISPTESLTQFGWIGPALSVMGNTARWAYSLNPDNDVIAATGYPLETLATSPGSLVNQCEIAVAGDSGKTYSASAWPTTPAAVTLTLTANTARAFGAFVRISNSTTNFKYGTYEIQLATGTTVLSYVLVQVVSLPIELVILAISNNAGKATIIADTAPAIIFPYSVTAGAPGNVNAGSFVSGDVLYAETLNMRDIGNIVDAVDNGAILI